MITLKTKELPRNLSYLSTVHNRIAEYYDGSFSICGGAIRALSEGNRVKDFDIFSPNPDKMVDSLKPVLEMKHSTESFVDFDCDLGKIQVIKSHKITSPLDIMDLFDFTVVCASFDGTTLYVDDRFWMDIGTKNLVIKNLPKPLSTFQRSLRYAKRGYTMCPVNQLKLMTAIQALPKNLTEKELQFYPDGTPRFSGID